MLWLLPIAAGAALLAARKYLQWKLYDKNRLPSGGRYIRVLTVKPGRFDEDIECDMDIVSLNDDVMYTYTALSYCWGQNKDTRSIKVDGLLVHFRRSLIQTMRYLRDERECRTFWIDGICINQKDKAEKDDQMKLMRDVYHRAEQTFVYIGEETDASRMVFEYLNSNKTTIKYGLDGDKITFDWIHHLRIWKAFMTDIYPRPYWKRLWIVQEIIMSRNPIVKCGASEITWDVFVAAWKIAFRIGEQEIGILRLEIPSPANYWKADLNLDTVEVMDDLRTAYGTSFRPDYNFWLQTFKHKLSQDAEDKVFALRGLAEDRDSRELSSLTNEQSAQTLFEAVTRYHLLKTGDLDVILYRGGSSKRLSGLPSWVPDYSQTGQVFQLSRDYFRQDDAYNAHGIGFAMPKYNKDESSMTMRGIYIDDIASVDDVDIEKNVLFDPPQKYSNEDIYPLSGTTYETAFRRMLLFERDRQGHRYPKYQSLDVMKIYTPRAMHDWEQDRHRGYCLVMTARGFMGLARDFVHKDDLVVVLYGCTAPVVLRNVGEKTGETTSEKTYEIICACYIQGIMSGEACTGTGVRDFKVV